LPSELSLKIKGISFLDNIIERIFKTGLTFHYNTNLEREQFENMKVEKQIAIIEEEKSL